MPDRPWERRILPRLRDATFLDVAALRAAQPAATPAALALAPGLFVTLVVDDEHSMTTVTGEMLAGWGESFAAAFAHARQNLLAISRDGFVELADGLWMAPWDDAYAASRVLLPELLQRLTVDPLVAVPNRDTLLVARAHSQRAQTALTTAIEKAVETSSFPIHRGVYRLRDKTLTATTLLDVRHHNLCVRELVQGYSEQQRHLQLHLGDACYAASIDVDEAPDGRLVTRALWTRGVDTLLPRVDRVHLLCPEDRNGEPISSRMFVASWNALAALPGGLFPTQHHLPRFRTGRFPDDGTLARCAVPIERDRRTAELSSVVP